MAFTFKVIKKDEQKTTKWSGGTTTQLYIYPENSEYNNKSFLWRLSSACVDMEESEFTHLPGIWRHIMIIEGCMQLFHENHHSKVLGPYEQDSFSGEWTTHSKGRVRDFNLMVAEGCRGYIDYKHLGKGVYKEELKWEHDDVHSSEAAAYYCTSGSINIKVDDISICTLKEGDLLLINREKTESELAIEFNNQDDKACLIISRILY